MRIPQRTLAAVSFCWLPCFFLTMAQGKAEEQPPFEHIRFDDLSAALPVQIAWSWNAIGMDADDNVYVVFGGPMGESHDCVLFQYRPQTGERLLRAAEGSCRMYG